MQLETTRFGTIEVDEQSVLTFTQPIIGFQDYRRFILLPGPEDSPLFWLQSTEVGDLAFILMNPTQVVPNYTVKIGAHELAELAASDVSDLEVYTLVVVPKNPAETRTNLKAPVLINPKQRLGKQTILDRSSYPVQFVLAQAQKDGDEPQEEVSNARSNS
jgi:flagellar assembly factor FliW